MRTKPTRQIVQPEFINASQKIGMKRLDALKKDPTVKVYDEIESQVFELIKIRHPGQPSSTHKEFLLERTQEYLSAYDVNDKIGNWVYYPWNNKLIHLLSREEFIELRTNRNKLKINEEEQQVLNTKKIGIAGLSVGRSIAMTLALERSVGEFRLADFDNIELSNLNRINAPLNELGKNKAIAAAHDILELDPYFDVIVYADGLHEHNFQSFFQEGGAIDLFVEECDGLDIKILSRHYAKKMGIPVFMEASDRCLIDVERFDEDPERPILHGLVQDLDPKHLKSLKTDEEKLPYLIKIVGLDTLSTRMKASMLEIQQTLTSWPQLGSDVTTGGGIGAEIVRNILLDKLSGSGRFHLDPYEKVPLRKVRPYGRYSSYQNLQKLKKPKTLTKEEIDTLINSIKKPIAPHSIEVDDISDLQEAAQLAPSGGNSQPWIWVYKPEAVYLFLDPSKTGTYLDKNNRASLIALGCSMCNFMAKGEELGYEIQQQFTENHANLTSVFYLNKNRKNRKVNNLSKGLYTRNTARNYYFRNEESETDKIASFLSKDSYLNLSIFLLEDIPTGIRNTIIEEEIKRIKNKKGKHNFFSEISFTASNLNYRREGIELNSSQLDLSELHGITLVKNSSVSDQIVKIPHLQSSNKIIRRVLRHPICLCMITVPQRPTDNTYIKTGIYLQKIWTQLHQRCYDLQPVSISSLTRNLTIYKQHILFMFTVHNTYNLFNEKSLRQL